MIFSDKRVLNSLMVTLLGVGIFFAATVLAQEDPGSPGPLAVTVEEYDFGDLAFSPTGFPSAVEVRASVHYPTALSGGPFPLVLFLHGRHATCYLGTSAFLQWPCTSPRLPIPSYQGYDYIGSILASHGYVVVSVSANGINAFDNSVFDLGMQARAELLQHHLNLWNAWNTVGGAPFGSKFVGKVNMANVGTMGHSRGGEGVVHNYNLNTSLGSPYGIRAVFPLAPVNFHRRLANNTALSVLLPYCDGDVSDLQGVHFYDDVRYNVSGDTASKHTVLVMGANHNFYNTVWTPGLFPAGTADDWTAFVSGGSTDTHCGPGVVGTGRLSTAEQRGTGLAYITAFFRVFLGGETDFFPILQGDAPPPPSAMGADIHVSYHPADAPGVRLDINRLLTSSDLSTNTLGGAATQTGITPYDLCGGEFPQDQHCLPGQSTSRQPHTTPSARSAARGLSQLRGGWSSTTAQYRNDLPVGFRDVTGFQVLQFRISVNFADFRNPIGAAQDIRVRLTDGVGLSATVHVSNYSDALFYPPGNTGPVPKVVLNTVRLPLSEFSGIDLGDVRSIIFLFDQMASGAVLVSDLALADSGTGLPPLRRFSCSTGFTATSIGISDHGGVLSFASPGPSGNEHLTARSGYQVCYRDSVGGAFSTSFDFGLLESGWSGGMTTSQPSGPGTFPLEITRTTADGKVRITRRFTANSFSQPCSGGACPPGFDTDGDGIACNILGDCGNCTNRTLHVLTRVTNLTGGNLFDVSVNELADFGISGESSSDRYVRTRDSVFAYKDSSDGTGAGSHQGMLLQTLIDTGVTGVLDSGSYAAPADCSVGTLATPASPGNYEAILSQPYGTLGAGANTGNTIRTHYRRF